MKTPTTERVASGADPHGHRRSCARPEVARTTRSFRALLATASDVARPAGVETNPPLRSPAPPSEARSEDLDLGAEGREGRPIASHAGGDMALPRVPHVRESFAVAPPPSLAPTDPAEIQTLAETMLRALRIGADGRGGHEAHLEVGRGRFAGTTIRIVEHAGRVRAEIGGIGGVDEKALTELARRLEEALVAKGIEVEEIEVEG